MTKGGRQYEDVYQFLVIKDTANRYLGLIFLYCKFDVNSLKLKNCL